jgi:D-beta-D-heptose 7-phosphate kinase/D-beta-D-heptose 1-phosphate adenosyltransferase
VKRVLVVGDAIADVYREFEYRKQCPDAPLTPVAVHVRDDLRPGGAANVAVNLAALAPDIAIDLISVLSVETARSVKLLGLSRVCMGSSLLVLDEQALIKERILIDGMDSDRRGFLVRLDNRRRVEPTDVEIIEENVQSYLEQYPGVDLIVLSDYAGGVLTDHLLQVLAPFRDRLIVDTKRTDLSCFSSGDRSPISMIPEQRSLMVKLNQEEHRRVLLDEAIPEKHFKYFVVTHGPGGTSMVLYRDTGELGYNDIKIMGAMSQTIRLKAIGGIDVRDVCGCGDTFLAGLAAGLLRFDDPYEALAFANAAAATVVSQPRTAVASLEETLRLLGRTVSSL